MGDHRSLARAVQPTQTGHFRPEATAMTRLILSALICTLLFGALALLGGAIVSIEVATALFTVAAAVLIVSIGCTVGGPACGGAWRRHLAWRDIDLY